MKIRIISPSKVRQPFIIEGENEYIKRLTPYAQIERVELAVTASSALPPSEVMKQEAGALMARIDKTEVLIALDEHGKEMSSRDFSAWLESESSSGHSRYCFIIGGAHGLDDQIKKKSSLVLSLSRLTYPYQLTRLVLIEQLYRAITMIKGIPYHK